MLFAPELCFLQCCYIGCVVKYKGRKSCNVLLDDGVTNTETCRR